MIRPGTDRSLHCSRQKPRLEGSPGLRGTGKLFQIQLVGRNLDHHFLGLRLDIGHEGKHRSIADSGQNSAKYNKPDQAWHGEIKPSAFFIETLMTGEK